MGEQARRVDQICWAAFSGAGDANISPVWAAYFLLLLRTALRASEGTHLRWDECNPRRRTITISRHKTARRRGAKVIPMVDDAFRLLEEVRGRGWCSYWVFPSPRANGTHVKDPYHPWNRVRTLAQCPAVRIHDIRHGFAQSMHDAGADIKQVRDMLGHSSVKTTEEYLGASEIGGLRAAATRAIGWS